MNHEKQYYLAKGGKSFGPYSEAEIEMMRENRSLESFNWIWSEGSLSWQPLDPAPALPALEKLTSPRGVTIAEPSIEAICYDFHSVASGRIVQANGAGCVFVTEDGNAPLFQERSQVVLNLLDADKGTSMNIRVRLGRVERKQRAWHYRLFWTEYPALLDSA